MSMRSTKGTVAEGNSTFTTRKRTRPSPLSFPVVVDLTGDDSDDDATPPAKKARKTPRRTKKTSELDQHGAASLLGPKSESRKSLASKRSKTTSKSTAVYAPSGSIGHGKLEETPEKRLRKYKTNVYPRCSSVQFHLTKLDFVRNLRNPTVRFMREPPPNGTMLVTTSI